MPDRSRRAAYDRIRRRARSTRLARPGLCGPKSGSFDRDRRDRYHPAGAVPLFRTFRSLFVLPRSVGGTSRHPQPSSKTHATCRIGPTPRRRVAHRRQPRSRRWKCCSLLTISETPRPVGRRYSARNRWHVDCIGGRHNKNPRRTTGLAGGYYKVSLQLLLVAVLDMIAAPLVSTVALIGAAQIMDVEFDQPYVLLAIFSALLCFMLVRQESADTRSMFVSGWTIATRAGLAWLVVVGTLLLIGYATKVSEIYSRRVLLLWFVGAPPFL